MREHGSRITTGFAGTVEAGRRKRFLPWCQCRVMTNLRHPPRPHGIGVERRASRVLPSSCPEKDGGDFRTVISATWLSPGLSDKFNFQELLRAWCKEELVVSLSLSCNRAAHVRISIFVSHGRGVPFCFEGSGGVGVRPRESREIARILQSFFSSEQQRKVGYVLLSG